MMMVADNVLFPYFHHLFLAGDGGGEDARATKPGRPKGLPHHSHSTGSWRTAVLPHGLLIYSKASHKRLREGMPTCGVEAQ